MHTEKSIFIATWVVAVGFFAYLSDPASFAGWTLLVAVAVTPPVIMMRLWRAPAQSISESIREAIR